MFSIQVYETALGASVPCGRRISCFVPLIWTGPPAICNAFQPRPKSGPPLLAYTCSQRSPQRQENVSTKASDEVNELSSRCSFQGRRIGVIVGLGNETSIRQQCSGSQHPDEQEFGNRH
jgi:hypothetical protein